MAKDFSFDPWLLSTEVLEVQNINFKEKVGMERIADSLNVIINKTQEAYDKYSISEPVSAFIKPNKGTFGIGVKSGMKKGDDVMHLNKKSRHSMYKIREGVINNEIIIQECIPTIEKSAKNHFAETLIYSVAGEIIGTMSRAVDDMSTNADSLSGMNSIIIPKHKDPKDILRNIKWLINKLAHLAALNEDYA